ncbi:MAG: hypothetical protein KAK00_03995 [Nanoarchaeota archaeon]|nr:hypothetical protein [Nanoarchaeota archaeon]
MKYIGVINAKRNAEKVDEFLFEAYQRFEKGLKAHGLSLLLAAAENYGAKYNSIKLTLESAKRNELLPDSFVIPDSIDKFKIYS